MAREMLEARIDANTSVQIVSVPIPKAVEPNDIVVRVICASCNPKDWKMPAGILKTIANCPNSGDDLAGVVHKVGTAVTSCKPGDRVAALHQLGAPFGAFAEYALVKDFCCFRLPDSMSWEQAATLPMAYYMACIALFGSLRLCEGPWARASESIPLLVYGASTGVGCMALKLAQIADIHPVICVAGSGCDFATKHIDNCKGDVVIDYRQCDDDTVEAIRSVLGGRKLVNAFDAVSEEHSLANVVKVLDLQNGKLALTLPGRSNKLPAELAISHVMAGSLWTKLTGIDQSEELGNLGLETGGPDFAQAMTSSIESLLRDGALSPHPHVVYEGGLTGLESALLDLRNGKVSGSRDVGAGSRPARLWSRSLAIAAEVCRLAAQSGPFRFVASSRLGRSAVPHRRANSPQGKKSACKTMQMGNSEVRMSDAPTIKAKLSIDPSSIDTDAANDPTVTITSSLASTRPVTFFAWHTFLDPDSIHCSNHFECTDLTLGTPIAIRPGRILCRMGGRFPSRRKRTGSDDFFFTLEPGIPLNIQQPFDVGQRAGDGERTEGHEYQYSVHAGLSIERWWYGRRDDVMASAEWRLHRWLQKRVHPRSHGGLPLRQSSGPPVVISHVEPATFEVRKVEVADSFVSSDGEKGR